MGPVAVPVLVLHLNIIYSPYSPKGSHRTSHNCCKDNNKQKSLDGKWVGEPIEQLEPLGSSERQGEGRHRIAIATEMVEEGERDRVIVGGLVALAQPHIPAVGMCSMSIKCALKLSSYSHHD